MFVNREKEIQRLNKAFKRNKAQLVVVYGRRRCGKSTLLKHILADNTIYYSADLREKPLQISSIANTIAKKIPAFNKVVYPDWESLFISLNERCEKRIVLCLDEFPYLVKNSPELPSVLQRIIDMAQHDNFHIVLCGSSQQMMAGMILDSSSPLYGRCDEILRIMPMDINYLKEYLDTDPINAIREYGVWGGVPRYWELRKNSECLEDAIKNNILDQNGILYEEPERLFLDELRTSVQAYSILSLVGNGVHRLSEIAARLEKPATQLSRTLGFLVNQGYLRREIPFRESYKSSKKSLYKIDDTFLDFYFTFLVPNRSRLEFDMIDDVYKDIMGKYDLYLSNIWEKICRSFVSKIGINGVKFNPCSRWWGNGMDNHPMEIDIVAESVDKKQLFIAEVKWSDSRSINELSAELEIKCLKFPWLKDHKLIKGLFIKEKITSPDPHTLIFGAKDIIS